MIESLRMSYRDWQHGLVARPACGLPLDAEKDLEGVHLSGGRAATNRSTRDAEALRVELLGRVRELDGRRAQRSRFPVALPLGRPLLPAAGPREGIVGEKSNREIVERYMRATVERDLDTQDQLRHAENVSEYPQSGERIRGTANSRAILEHYPGGLPPAEVTKLHGSADQWVATPAGTVLRITGSGDVYTALVTAMYPGDDRPWHIAVVAELRDSTVVKETVIFGAAFDPPAWRAQWVDRI